MREPAFASFEGESVRVRLLPGYRDLGKGRWRGYWWSTAALMALARRGALDAPARAIVDELLASRTLPRRIGDYAREATRLAATGGHLLEPIGRFDERLGVEVLAAPPRENEIAELAQLYRGTARATLDSLEACGLDVERARILEVGCGRGYAAFAFAGLGVGAVTGVDLDLRGHVSEAEIAGVKDVLAGDRTVRLDEGDVYALPYPDESFDAVTSVSVIEHLNDLPRAFSELRRVTARRGFGYHAIDPWFGPAGGHDLCTLDFPWGHVRLCEDDFARYVEVLRPYEADEAVKAYRHAFQLPRATLEETTIIAREAGFEVLAARSVPVQLRDPHRAWFSTDLLSECRRVHPRVTAGDLLAVTTSLVLRRR